MKARDHTQYENDVGAYLLGALTELERHAFERHLARCSDCQEEVERLRPAADTLPAAVEQVEPPPRLKGALMEVVEREAKAARPARETRRRAPAWWRSRFARPALVAATLLIGVAAGFGLAQLGANDTRTVRASADEAIAPAGGTLRISGDSATLRLHDMPALGRGRVYQAWLERGKRLVPAPTFEVDREGQGTVSLRDVEDADAVYVTREAHGGARVPSEPPIISVRL